MIKLDIGIINSISIFHNTFFKYHLSASSVFISLVLGSPLERSGGCLDVDVVVVVIMAPVSAGGKEVSGTS